MLSGNNIHKQPFKHAQTAGNLTENAQNLRNDKYADKHVKRNVNKRYQRK